VRIPRAREHVRHTRDVQHDESEQHDAEADRATSVRRRAASHAASVSETMLITSAPALSPTWRGRSARRTAQADKRTSGRMVPAVLRIGPRNWVACEAWTVYSSIIAPSLVGQVGAAWRAIAQSRSAHAVSPAIAIVVPAISRVALASGPFQDDEQRPMSTSPARR